MERRNHKKFPYTSLWFENDPDIVYWDYVPKLDIDIKIAQELVANRLEYCQGKSYYAMIDVSNVKSSTREARDFLNTPEFGLKNILGGAFLSKNVVATLAINIFLKVAKPSVPAKFFTDKSEALRWIYSLKSKAKNLTLGAYSYCV